MAIIIKSFIMVGEDVVEFYKNWNLKIDSNAGEELNDVYNRYRDLVAIYNKLYTQVPDALIAKGNPYRGNITDSAGAIDIVLQFLGGSNILANFRAKGIIDDIQGIATLIDQKVFYLTIRHGQRDANADTVILRNLRSTDDDTKAKAMLRIIYLVRCNLVHGSKDYQEYQRLLLEPLTRLFRSIIEQLYSELSK